MPSSLQPIAKPTENPCRCGGCRVCRHFRVWWDMYHGDSFRREAMENDPEVIHGWAGLS